MYDHRTAHFGRPCSRQLTMPAHWLKEGAQPRYAAMASPIPAPILDALLFSPGPRSFGRYAVTLGLPQRFLQAAQTSSRFNSIRE